MTTNAEIYLETKARMSAAKGLVTRSIKKLEASCEEFSSRQDIPDRTKNRLATEILESRKKVEKNLAQMDPPTTPFTALSTEYEPLSSLAKTFSSITFPTSLLKWA